MTTWCDLPDPSGEHVMEHARDALHDLIVDVTRCRQVDAGGRKLGAVGAAAGILAVRRQRRQRMEERPGLDLVLVRCTHDRQTLVGRHLDAGQPDHALLFLRHPGATPHVANTFYPLPLAPPSP